MPFLIRILTEKANSVVNLLSPNKLTAFIVLPVVIVLILSGATVFFFVKSVSDSAADSLILYLVILTITAIIVVSVIGHIISKRVTKPIRKLKEISRHVEMGNYDIDKSGIPKDESGDVIKSLLSLVNELAIYQKRLNEVEKHSQTQVKEAIYKTLDNVKFEAMDEKQLASNLRTMVQQLRESKTELKEKQDELEKSNFSLMEAEEKLRKFNEKLEVKVKERTKELVDANIRIQRLLDMKSQFVSQVSHDLRTPLTPILTLMPLIQDEITNLSDDKTRKDLLEMLDKVQGNAEYLSNIVTDTLSISRLDTGKTKLNLQTESLYDLVSDLLANEDVVFKEKQIKVVNNIKKNIPKVQIDKLRIREVIENLVTNAIRFMEEKKELTFDAEVGKLFVTLSLRDTGIGIEKQHLTKIFEEFFKVDPARHEHTSGLGLSICKRIVEKHGGRIWAESPGLGKGTTFYFTMPIAKA